MSLKKRDVLRSLFEIPGSLHLKFEILCLLLVYFSETLKFH